MSCDKCDCMDCRVCRAIQKAKNMSNDMDDEPVATDENLDDGWATPIHRPSAAEVEPANEVQAEVWMKTINDIFDKYKVETVPMPTMLSMVCTKVGVRHENFPRVSEQVRKFINESPAFEVRRGKGGGIFRREAAGGSDRSFVPQYVELKPATNIPDMITGKLPDDCNCKGCGTGLNSSERSCWKCGAVQ